MSKITGDPEVDAALAADMTIDITTIGRASGKGRRIEIWFLNVGGRIFITGTPGPRDWVANLAVDHRLMFHLKESTQADLAATARTVIDPDTRRMVFDDPSAHWYREQTTMQDLLENAPMIEIFFDS